MDALVNHRPPPVVVLLARPVEVDLHIRVGHGCAYGKSIDACYRSVDRIVRAVADLVRAVQRGRRACNDARQEFCLIQLGVISPNSLVRQVDRAVEEDDIFIPDGRA